MQLKKIKDFPYMISSQGKIFRITKKGIKKEPLKPSLVHGYEYVNLYKDGKQYGFQVHSLVAETFIKKPNQINIFEVDHIDRNKLNNNINNLRWVTRKDNLNNRITTDIQKELKRLYSTIGHQKVLEILKTY